MVAQLSQNMNFLADMSVGDFLSLHAKCRCANTKCVDAVLDLCKHFNWRAYKKRA